uniref:MAS1 proto-oncogene, G protein-coupled receptor n=1 Tax=Varanus komodoensis TaxID=61221 RepID=A0A8D2LSU6_VARKO
MSSLSILTTDVAKMNETQVQNRTARDGNDAVVLACAIMPVAILGLVGNGIVFWFLCCRIKRTKYTVYVLNLAVADFTVLFCYFLSFIFSFVIWKMLAFDLYLFFVIDILTLFSYNSSFFLLTAISVERHLGAFYPFWYHFNRPKHLSAILCAFLWVLSFAVTGVEYSTCWAFLFVFSSESQGNYPAEKIFLTTIFLIFIPVMILCSSSLLVKICRNSQPKSPPRLYVTIIITVVLFLIFALPFRLLSLIRYWHPSEQISWIALFYSTFLNFINSSVNPFVYFLVGRKKQQTSKEALHLVIYRSCRDEDDNCGSNTTTEPIR